MARKRSRSRSSSTKSHPNGAAPAAGAGTGCAAGAEVGTGCADTAGAGAGASMGGAAAAAAGAGAGTGCAGGAGGAGGARAPSKLELGGLVYFSLRKDYLAACERNDERRKDFLKDLMNYASNFHVDLDEQIMLLMLPLVNAGILKSSFTESINSLEGREHAVGLYQMLREAIDRFLLDGHCLMSDLGSYLDRWDPDLKAVAKAAKAFGSLARLICWDEMVELCNKLEAASLDGNSPIEICGPFWKARGLYEKFRLKLYLLLTLAHKGLGTHPPPIPGTNPPWPLPRAGPRPPPPSAPAAAPPPGA